MEDIKNLIEKIQQEGIQEAQNKARQIEERAKNEASAIIKKAEAEAKNRIADAKEDISKAEASSTATLKQASRNTLLSLRKEIESMLGNIITEHIQDALTPESMSKIIVSLIKENATGAQKDIVVSLKKDDAEKLEKSFLSDLKEAAKKNIILKVSDDMTGGFIISYDGGKSHYDFSDEALAKYLGTYLEPKLRELLKDSAKDR